MKLALRMVPRGLQERAAPLVRRGETFLKNWEWTWTKAVLASLILWFLGLTFLAVIPSWWLYFAEETLGWRQDPARAWTFWLPKARDVVAIILFSIPFGAFVMIPYHLMNLRRKLRGQGGDTRPTGGYR